MTTMSRIVILGATGTLGQHVLHQALAAGLQVTVVVRTPSRLPDDAASQVSIHTGDLSVLAPADLAGVISGHDALINCAGHVMEGQSFVDLIDRMPYADAAALMLANLDPGNAMARHRVGLALPLGMRGNKSQWAAKPRNAA
jgi:uncharacterized protein YbjT (DUF2867 family)